ncbi:uncharacterized protein LOC129292800 [Prosopis cineraria]|uniref:uncharacterized protein LOC129292800 n=1 Tax=Prosopis cineraria TaxID=364024 RepID=UPI00240F1020|nr:uncharacterized protein LOC129292800 [Prosopis cineraria]
MDGSEGFTFPRISDNCPFTIDSPPLWNIPSPSFSAAATDQDARKATESEAKLICDGFLYENDENTMDLLWENFNEDLHSTSASATSSSTEMVEARCGSEALTVVKSNGSVIASNSCKPGTLVLLKLLKKLFSVTHPHRKPTATTAAT